VTAVDLLLGIVVELDLDLVGARGGHEVDALAGEQQLALRVVHPLLAARFAERPEQPGMQERAPGRVRRRLRPVRSVHRVGDWDRQHAAIEGLLQTLHVARLRVVEHRARIRGEAVLAETVANRLEVRLGDLRQLEVPLQLLGHARRSAPGIGVVRQERFGAGADQFEQRRVVGQRVAFLHEHRLAPLAQPDIDALFVALRRRVEQLLGQVARHPGERLEGGADRERDARAAVALALHRRLRSAKIDLRNGSRGDEDGDDDDGKRT
jgi:hypothetical protein